jgi:endonuclease/exonuclease/phosphatase family metal-dependent hydrolase
MVASKHPIKQIEVSYSRWPPNRRPILNAIYCVVETPLGDVGFCNLHLDTPRRALSAILDREKILDLNDADYANFRLECRRLESIDLLEWLNAFPEPKVIAGDFNTTSDSPILREDWDHFHNAFTSTGWGLGRTKQTVIRDREYALRIDHIFVDEHWTPVSSWIGSDLGSDHLPLFADIARNRP